jgi:hypothetical protein
MYARDVDEAAVRLGYLRRQTREQLGVAAVALVLAVGAAVAQPVLAVPLFLGGVVVGALGLRSFWCHWDLLDRLAADRDAHTIPEVRAYAGRGSSNPA